ncbi:MAG TPA: agmatinase family protein [Actinomycetota bacterium]|nr:agmatinase family protein [Actinomycetota bacterium]
MPDDPNWPRASEWLAGNHLPDPLASLAVIGVPTRLASLSGGRFDLAPDAIRQALRRFSTFDGRTDVRAVRVYDEGDLDVAERPMDEDVREDHLEGAMEQRVHETAWALLGGDNSITWAAAHTAQRIHEPLGLITLDAHHDLRATTEGISNGSPIRALLEDESVRGPNVYQVGIQAFANSRAYATDAQDEGIHVSTVDDVRARGINAVMSEALEDLSERCDAVYVDLDVDVLDRAFAPASPGSRPGGLMPWELHRAAFLAGAHPKVRAIDIVEVDPERDVADVTVMNAARCLLSFAAGLASRRPEA